MSVVVIGMDMPSGCQSCDFSDDETRFCKAAKEYIPMLGKPEFCPLVELPEKHGKLIDADAFIQQCRIEGENHTLTHDINRYKLGMGELIDLINVQPTIMEAEGE